MTRKTYIETAQILRATQLEAVEGGYNSPQIFDDLAQRLANMFAADNGRFDRDRFLIASGVK